MFYNKFFIWEFFVLNTRAWTEAKSVKIHHQKYILSIICTNVLFFSSSARKSNDPTSMNYASTVLTHKY